MSEQIVAQIELNVAGDTDDNPAREKEENAPHYRQRQNLKREDPKLVPGDATFQALGCIADHSGQQCQCAVTQNNAERTDNKSPAIALEIWQQRTHALRNHVVVADEILAGGGACFGWAAED